MPTTSTRFQNEQAPCGRIVAGEHYQDQDDEALVTDDWRYDCGCRTTRHEYHDGSVGRKVVHHKGKVLVDELIAGH